MSEWFTRFGFAEVADDLLIGAYPQDADDVAELHAAGVTRVFNLVQDIEYEEPGGREACAAALRAAGIEESRIEVVDYGSLLPGQLEQAVGVVLGWLDGGERVYAHCRAGWQRSAAVAAGVVALRDEIGLPEALGRIRERKPTAEPLPHQREDLANWWAQRNR
ncbi:MAG: dual specificity protein phosphatase family protein [Solirubrobacterales bacterium]|nr:dual specificity protein phosphatase family protein [Solirubrobacterales bacterium]